jgi:hypothetical protein
MIGTRLRNCHCLRPVHIDHVISYPTPPFLSADEQTSSVVSLFSTVMYNGIGLTTPRGRYVFYCSLLGKAFLDQFLLLAVLTVMSSAISLSCGPATLKMTVPPRGMLPHQSIGNQTRRFSNMKGKGRWRSNAWSFSSN